MNRTIETIFNRKSVRKFKEGTIDKSTLELIVKTGMAAPSAVDKRPWEFIIITDRNVLQTLAKILPYAKMAEKAAAGIIVAGNKTKQWGGEDSDYWVQDCSAATENILLAVESLGLGAVWTALHPYKDRKKPVADLLGIPSHIEPLNFIPIGIPEGIEKPKDKFNPGAVHFEKW
ncbi:MAG: nitroreductase family protein [Ignavibacteria bacterium]|nr:nitroreductase family protein [Ignavibacteria bacterium]